MTVTANHFNAVAAKVGICMDGVSPVYAGSSSCVTCDKEMTGCWDTVCWACGHTSCYEHAHTFYGDDRWFCARCCTAMVNESFHPSRFKCSRVLA